LDIVGSKKSLHQNSIILVLELEDSDLDVWMIQNENVPLDICRYIIGQVLVGLNFLHSNHVMHRDLKPGTISKRKLLLIKAIIIIS
jgi:serine/threonine protein kinase